MDWLRSGSPTPSTARSRPSTRTWRRGRPPQSLLRAKHAAEQHLIASDLDWTILRPASYLEVWLAIVRGKLDTGGPALVLGRCVNPINFVSIQDVAAVVEHCLVDPTTVRQAIDVAGPQNLTLLELARAQGAPKIKHVPLGALRTLQHFAKPFAPAFAPTSSDGRPAEHQRHDRTGIARPTSTPPHADEHPRLGPCPAIETVIA